MNNIIKICLLGIGLALAAVYVFRLPVSSLFFFAFLLACPLMHIFMMHGEHGKTSKHSHH